ncbi:MAG: hypothetical protein NTV62_04365, partial [Candidatus Gribaldobacteria bacterium]|nr:hypothetical protein [Candidatus Gribaldobacteria bacterium]
MAKIKNFSLVFKVVLGACLLTAGFFCVQQSVLAADLSVSCQAVPSTAKVGDTVTFQTFVSGGTGNYSNYTWYATLNGRTGPEPMLYLDSAGVKTAYLQVSDGVQTAQSARCSVTATANTPTPPVVSDLSVSCQAVPPTAKVGDTVSFRALSSGGTGNYSNYTWFGALNGRTGPEPMLYLSSVGTKYASVQVSDGTQTVQSTRCSVTVADNTPIITPTPTPTPVSNLSVSCQAVPSTAKVGDTVSFRALPSEGTGNYSNYTWFG